MFNKNNEGTAKTLYCHRRSDQEWVKLIEEYQQSDLSIRKRCQQNKVDKSPFLYNARKLHIDVAANPRIPGEYHGRPYQEWAELINEQ